MIRPFVILLLTGLGAVGGCNSYSLPATFSDLSHDPGGIGPSGSQEDAVRRIKESLAKEMTQQSTVQDGYHWFDRHGIPLDSGHDARTREISGYMPFSTQGFWASTSVSVRLEFDEHGKYKHGDASWSASNL